MTESSFKPTNFIEQMIAADLESDKHGGKVQTRFPPEPNGYLHIGHAKSICLNFGIAEDIKGAKCNLRFDDTNPTKEDVEYVDSIMEDIQWLGFEWSGLFYASNYFDRMYEYAVQLIKLGKAYVCSLTPDQMRGYRGTLTEPGKESPWRDTSVEENLDLFERMRKGEFEEGEKVLRAKIDMHSPNLNMRDPVVYRIKKAVHHRTGDKWLIYPMYDFAHCLSDMIEGITHSICTLEFEDHRPLYDWYLNTLKTPCHPQQIEFARLNLNYTVMSKRLLLQLVEEDYVDGWNDPRMPTISGMRRRGYPPAAIRDFCDRIGVTKKDSCIEYSLLEQCVREHMDVKAARRMAVLDPIKVVMTNYPEDQVEEMTCKNHPKDESMGTRNVPFSRELYIERADFMESPPKNFYRLSPGGNVRLRNAYVITCDEVIKDDKTGEVTELHCSYHLDTKHGKTPEGMKKVKGIIHWVSAKHAFTGAQVRVYDRLFSVEFPSQDKSISFKEKLNPNSLMIKQNAKLEGSLADAKKEQYFQFERLGYFFVDPYETTDEQLVFNQTVSLKDSWAKEA
ncbi:MAG: glutamine--tRNA ligase/YqeY domain fusion protein [Pseudomonadota bacterium]